MSFDLEGSRVVVTGAARGIGRAISVRFGELGAQVCGWDIRSDLMRSETNVFKHAEEVDVSDEHSVQRAATSTLNAIGGVDVCVANAGVNGPTKPTWRYSVEEWQRVVDVNLTGVFLTTRAFLNSMRERGAGRHHRSIDRRQRRESGRLRLRRDEGWRHRLRERPREGTASLGDYCKLHCPGNCGNRFAERNVGRLHRRQAQQDSDEAALLRAGGRRHGRMGRQPEVLVHNRSSLRPQRRTCNILIEA